MTNPDMYIMTFGARLFVPKGNLPPIHQRRQQNAEILEIYTDKGGIVFNLRPNSRVYTRLRKDTQTNKPQRRFYNPLNYPINIPDRLKVLSGEKVYSYEEIGRYHKALKETLCGGVSLAYISLIQDSQFDKIRIHQDSQDPQDPQDPMLELAYLLGSLRGKVIVETINKQKRLVYKSTGQPIPRLEDIVSSIMLEPKEDEEDELEDIEVEKPNLSFIDLVKQGYTLRYDKAPPKQLGDFA